MIGSGAVKLSDQAIENILHVISTFDRERGIPHDYHDLEVVLRNTHFRTSVAGELEISQETVRSIPLPSLRVDSELDDVAEAKELLLLAARSWVDV